MEGWRDGGVERQVGVWQYVSSMMAVTMAVAVVVGSGIVAAVLQAGVGMGWWRGGEGRGRVGGWVGRFEKDEAAVG